MVRTPLSKEVRYIYRYIYGMLQLPLDMEVIARERIQITEQLARVSQGD